MTDFEEILEDLGTFGPYQVSNNLTNIEMPRILPFWLKNGVFIANFKIIINLFAVIKLI